MAIVQGFVLSIYRNGVILIATITIAFTCLAVILATKDRNTLKRGLVLVIALFFCVYSWNHMVKRLGATPSDSREALSIINRQVINTLIYTKGNVDERDKHSIMEAYKVNDEKELKKIVEKYSVSNADKIKTAYGNTDEVNKNYILTYLKLASEYPGCCIDAVLKGTYGYWWIGYSAMHVARSVETGMVEADFANERMKETRIGDPFAATTDSLGKNGIDTSITFGELLQNKQEAEDLLYVKSSNPHRDFVNNIFAKMKKTPIVSIFLSRHFIYIC